MASIDEMDPCVEYTYTFGTWIPSHLDECYPVWIEGVRSDDAGFSEPERFLSIGIWWNDSQLSNQETIVVSTDQRFTSSYYRVVEAHTIMHMSSIPVSCANKMTRPPDGSRYAKIRLTSKTFGHVFKPEDNTVYRWQCDTDRLLAFAFEIEPLDEEGVEDIMRRVVRQHVDL